MGFAQVKEEQRASPLRGTRSKTHSPIAPQRATSNPKPVTSSRIANPPPASKQYTVQHPTPEP